MTINHTWAAEKAEYLEKLDKQMQAIDNILKMEAGSVINADVRRQLKSLQSEARLISKKIKSDEFEIAIVGLEKAGKSTFANALMENVVLPTAGPRCTYTATRIEYSGEDHNDSANVTFFNIGEFNEDFRDKLAQLGFPNPERYSFDTLTLETYLNIYENDVSDDKKRQFGDSLNEDIIDIIKNADSISELLGLSVKAFSADSIKAKEHENYITKPSKAFAVKEVLIKSQKLHRMPTAVIFDVPGFNSPTALHRAQTLERMKSADAIIVVAKGDEPSLTADVLSIFRNSDDDGTPLKDKLFVFANKIERSSDISVNIDTTYSEWIQKRKLLSENLRNRIVFGSAKAHLQECGLETGDNALRDLKEYADLLPHGDGIDHIRASLAEYNQNERFEVLKRRINRLNQRIADIFHDVMNEYSDVSSDKHFDSESWEQYGLFLRNYVESAKKSLQMMRDKVKREISSTLPLSAFITEYIENEITVEKYQPAQAQVDKAVMDSDGTISNFVDTVRVEIEIRKAKAREMYDDFSSHIIGLVGKQHCEYSEMILDLLVYDMGLIPSDANYCEIRSHLGKELAPFRKDIKETAEEGYYQSLIERYSRDLYDILIYSQYSPERLKKFYQEINNFYSLSIYYSKDASSSTSKNSKLFHLNIAPKDQPLCKMLLFHTGNNISAIASKVSDYVLQTIGLPKISENLQKHIEQAVAAFEVSNQKFLDVFASKFNERIKDMSADFKEEKVIHALTSMIEMADDYDITNEESFRAYYEEYHSRVKGGKEYTIDDFKREFAKDIETLQDVLKNAFVKAISMEKPFIAREVKSIEDIIEHIESPEFNRFLSHNFRRIKAKDFAALDRERREFEQNAAIIHEINEILNTLKN